jgi:hypothetical protein
MRLLLLMVVFNFVGLAGCSRGSHHGVTVGIYRAHDQDELIEVYGTRIRFRVRESLDDRQVGTIEGTYRYSLDRDGSIYLYGRSSDRDLVVLCHSDWRFDGKSIERTYQPKKLVYKRRGYEVQKLGPPFVASYVLESK